MQTCLNFHYSEYEGSKDDILELNASICRLIDHEIKQFEKLQKKIDKIEGKEVVVADTGATKEKEISAKDKVQTLLKKREQKMETKEKEKKHK